MPPLNNPPRIVFSKSTLDNSVDHIDDTDDSNNNTIDSDDDMFSELELIPTNGNENGNGNNHINTSPNVNVRRSINTSRNPLDTTYKRLSIFTDNNETAEDQVLHTINKLKKKNNSHQTINSHNIQKLDTVNNKNKKHSLKIIIPDNNNSMKKLSPGKSPLSSTHPSPRLSPRLNTPITFQTFPNQTKDQLEDDFSSALDDALFKSVWMPSKDNKSSLKTSHSFRYGNSNSSNVSNTLNTSNSSLRQRKRNSITSFSGSRSRSNSISFNHDLENNDAIPLDNLNFKVPIIQVDNYMDGLSPTHQSFNSPELNTTNNNFNNRKEMKSEDENISNGSEFNSIPPPSAISITTDTPDSNIRSSMVTKVFAKISNLVNSDTVDLIPSGKSEENIDNISFISNRDTSISNNNSNSPDDPFILDNNLLNSSDKINEGLDIESIFTYYMDETERNNLLENTQDEIYQLDPFADKANHSIGNNNSQAQNALPLEIEIDTDSNDEDLPLFGKSLRHFGPESDLRKSCYLLLTYPPMNQVLTLMLIIQVAILFYQQWKFENGYVFAGKYTWIDWILFVFYSIYTVEMFSKIIAFGFYDDSQMVKILRLQRYQSELQKFYSKIRASLKGSKYFGKSKSFFSDKYKRIKIKSKNRNIFKNSSLVNLNLIPNKSDKKNENTFIDDQSSGTDNVTIDPKEKYKDHPIHYPYLRTEWNRIDFVSIICFWISFFLSLNGTDIGKYQVFRSLMCLRILRLLNITKGSRVILRGLRDAAIQSKQVVVLLLCFWFLLSIVGVESFKASFRRHCVWTNPNNSTDTYSNEFQFCGSYLDPITLAELPYIDDKYMSSGTVKGYTCPVNSQCIMTENPYNGRVSFDNIAQSLQSVFVIMSANTFTDLMYYTMDSDSMVSSLFFIISIFVLAVWMINLVVAVIIHSYKTEEKSRKQHTSWHKKYQDKYMDFTSNSKLFIISKRFDIIFVMIILVSFIISATKKRHNGELNAKYNYLDFITSIIMMVEILCRIGLFIYAGNWRVFFYSIFNWVDLFSSILSLVFSLPPIFKALDSIVYGWLSVFGIIRFYRVVMFITPVRKSWELALKRTKPFAELVLFGFMLLCFVSIIMSRLFEGVVPVSEMDDNQWIMYNLPNCVVSLFIITTTENWTEVLYTTEQYASNTFTSFCISIYLLSWFVISNTVLLSIFIAIITDNLELPESEKKVNQIKQFVKSCVSKVKNNKHEGLVDLMKNNFDRNAVSDEANNFINHMNELLVSNGQAPIDVDNFDVDEDMIRQSVRRLRKSVFKEYRQNSLYLKTIIRTVFHKLKVLDTGAVKSTRKLPFLYKYVNKFRSKVFRFLNDSIHTIDVTLADTNPFSDYDPANYQRRNEQNIDRSLMIFTNYNPIRRFCQMLISPNNLERTEGRQPAPKLMYAFNVFMFLASVVVVILACYETPLYRGSISNTLTYKIWTSYADIVFMVIFSIEFFIKIIADGCLWGPRAYFKSTWNDLDFIVLLSFWVTVLSVLNNNYSLVVTFGALKALRAFRLLTITKESQLVFHFAIISGAYKILSAAMVSLSLLIPFALWGLNIFSDELSYCSDGVSDLENCSLEYYNEVFKWEIYSPNYVETPYLSFDNFAASIKGLFEILSLEGWVDMLTNVMNITKYGQQPSTFASSGNGVFVIIFIFCAAVFIINLFISIIINNYTLQTGVAFLNDEQYGWYEVKKVLSMVKPSKRRDDGEITPFQKIIFKFVSKKNGIWSRFISITLVAHFALLISESYPYSYSGTTVRNSLFVVTTTILLIHMILLQFSLGTRVFYSNRMNLFMMIVVISALVMTCISFGVSKKTVFTNINKSFLVAVLCLIIPQVDMLNQLIKYGSTGLFSLISLLYTWLVLFLVFAIALNQLFGMTRLGENTTGNLNTRTVTKALIMLFRNSFGEGWNQIMIDFEISEPYCTNNGYSNSDCGSRPLALLLFICWNILSMYIFLNILISVVITNFSYIYHGSGPHKLITREEIRKFKRAWNCLDVNGSGYIYESDLFKFMHSLDGVLSYHVYPKFLSLPTITEKTVFQKDLNNGYDIEFNITKMQEILSFIDFRKARKRRIRYERLISELLACSIAIAIDDPEEENGTVIRKIPFKESLLIIGYYSRFEDSTCLNLEDFLRHSTQIKNINRGLRRAKIVSTIKMIFTRLRYKFAVDKMKIFDKIANASPFEKEVLKERLRNSLKGNDLSYEILTDNTIRVVDPENPIFNNNLYRVMSASSRNPFSDAYVTNQSVESFISEDDVIR